MELFKKNDCTIVSNEIEVENSFIFNTNKYYQIHKTDNCTRLIFYYKAESKAIINIIEENNYVISPIKATFGGFEFLGKFDSELCEIVIETFIEFIKKKYGQTNILITQPPFFYCNNQSVITNILLGKGFLISGNELNHYTPITDFSLISKMNKTSKKKFNRLNKLGLKFEFSKDLRLSYDVLKENRKKRGVTLSLSYESVLEMMENFADKTFFFDLKNNEDIISSAFCVSISENVLYVLYWGHNSKYDDLSPVVFLANSIYDFAKDKNYKILDIGTSSVNGKIDAGLTKFKESLGFLSDLKFTLIKYKTNA